MPPTTASRARPVMDAHDHIPLSRLNDPTECYWQVGRRHFLHHTILATVAVRELEEKRSHLG
jgi:hypothetical protein